jgi:amino acid transporter
MELPTWPKKPVDPRLQTTVLVLTGTLAALTLIEHFVIRFYEIFVILPYLAIAALYAYSWRKDRNFLGTWWIQYAIVPNIAVSFVEAFFYARRGDAYSLLVGGLWLLPAAAWIALSMRAEYEKYLFLWGVLAKQSLVTQRLFRLSNLFSDEEKAKMFPPDSEDFWLKVIALMPPERQK